MAQANETPSAEYTPRPPNTEEKKQLADWLLATGAYEPEIAEETVNGASIAVFDSYCTGSPGYVGKVMAVVWDGAPAFYDTFIWQDGAMEHCEREGGKECGHIEGRKEKIAEEVMDALGEILVRRFPQAKTGDLSPLTTIALVRALENAIEEWVSNNVPHRESGGAA